jgi:FMN phosphatase YigB (HAD superfamily)
MKYEINFDCDGVLADFDGHIFQMTGKTAAELDREKMLWKVLEAEGRFFRHLPKIEAMVEFAHRVKSVAPIRVITGRPRRETMPHAESDKIEWIRETLGGDVPVIVCLARHKHHHMRKTDGLIEVLIDDRFDNIERWQAAGGIGVFHTDPAETIPHVSSLLKL